METLFSFIDWVTLQFHYMVTFIESIPSMFTDLMSYIQLYYIKLKIYGQIEFIKLSYNTAQILLQELGFNDVLTMAFNSLPSELRFYAFKFGLPEGLSILANFFTTAFVMRMSK